ncbi:unnamed protein product [Choristocarpus tenellus]
MAEAELILGDSEKDILECLEKTGAHYIEDSDSDCEDRSTTPRSRPRSRPHLSPRSEGKMSARYSRVSTGETRSNSVTEEEEKKRKRSQLAERISNKLHAAFWVILGVFVVYQTDFVKVILEDERINRLWFNVGVLCFGVNIVIMAYLTIWLPHVKGVKVSWNVYSPRAIPTTTVLGLICALTLNVSLWGVWGFLTPLILFAVFISCLFSLHFIPWPC